MKRKSPRKTKTQVSDLDALLKPYSSGWVALSPDEKQVVAAASTLHEAHRRAARQGHPHPVFVKIKEFQLTPAQKKTLVGAQRNLKKRRTVSLNEFGKALGLAY